ncbi:PilE-like protein [Candidatus Saccharibacteria bacterium RAAC3_TM7_1]|nr:PilE-like protein [Candidatus Saccharibacteria bacterium RAAC3_TM7_1]HCZ28760.1 prepilin-type N-terminal cleavage/methylation domain-containing protein [Candidatus Saccharibacteria bacterium]
MKHRGFTIVELLIVIVVIAILAAITVVAYNGIQQRARDAQRLQDITSIAKALELYKIQNSSYPNAVGNSVGGWEISSNPKWQSSVFAATGDGRGTL